MPVRPVGAGRLRKNDVREAAMTLHSVRPLPGFVRWRVPLVRKAIILGMVLLIACAPAQPPTTAPPPGAEPGRQPQAAQGAVPTEWVVGIADEAPSLDPGLSPSIASATTAQLH